MTLELASFVLILCIMVAMFLTDILSIDLTALAGLLLLVLCGFISPDEAFDGFASPAVILMLATFALSGALRLSGASESVSGRIVRVVGTSETAIVMAVMLVAALTSSVMNNVAATAVLLPGVSAIASRTRIPPSRLFLPLSFGVLLGGTTTLIGTSSNVLASEILRSKGFAQFRFFEFFPIGILLVIAGVIAVGFIGRHFLPGAASDQGKRGDLFELYRLKERMVSLRIPKPSRLHNQTLARLHFAEMLGAEVLAIKRSGKTFLAPNAEDKVQEGDLLIVRGRLPELQALFRLHGVRVRKFEGLLADANTISIEGARIKPTRKLLSSGKTLKELNFRARFSLLVLGIERDEEIIRHDVTNEALTDSDVLRVVGESSVVDALEAQAEFLELEERYSIEKMFEESVFVLDVPSISALSDVRIRDSRLGELVNLSVVGIIRGDKQLLCISGDEKIQANDSLLVAGQSEYAERLSELSELSIESETVQSEFESPEIGIMEVVLSPRSKLIGRTIEEIQFREQYGFRVLAIWRDGEPKRARFSRFPLRFGDALLLQGPRNRMALFAKDPDFVVLSDVGHVVHRTEKRKWAIGALLLMVLLSVFHVEPPHVAAALAAVIVILSGAVSMEEFYREVEWRVVVLISALLPIGAAFDRTGLSQYISSYITTVCGTFGSNTLVLIFCVLASVLSQLLDSSIIVVLLGPIAVASAAHLGASPHLYLMSVALGASLAFMHPFSARCHLLIMGPGGYKARDFVKIGTLLSLVSFAVVALFLPWLV